MSRCVAMTFVLMLPAAAAFGQWEPGEPVALDVVCDGEYRTQVYIDGQQGDWDAESPAVERVMQLVAGGYQYDWTGPNDASFKYWCRYNEHGLSFAVVGRDNVILAPDGSSPGDRMELWMELDRPGARTSERVVMVEIPIWPVLTDRYTTPVWGAGTGRTGELTTGRAELAPTDTGFFLEFNVPFLAVGEYAEPYAPMRFMLVQRDWDNDAEIEEEVAVGTSPLVTDEPEQWGWMRFTGETDIAGQVRETLSYGPAVMPFGTTYGPIGGGTWQDMAFAMGSHVVAAGRGFGAFSWQAALVTTEPEHTPLSLALQDIDGDGNGEIFYRWSVTVRDPDADRELVQEFMTVFRVSPESIERIIFQEVANEIAGVGRFEMEMRVAQGTVSFRKPTSSTLSRDAWFDVDAQVSPEYYQSIAPWENGTRVVWSSSDGTWIAARE